MEQIKKRPAKKSDYQNNQRGVYGGKLEEFPRPVAWYWPKSKEKRRVKCNISTWVGRDPDASHYHAEVSEEYNWAWNGVEWAVPFHNPSKQYGRSYFECFLTEKQAVDWINEILQKHFSADTHRLYGGSTPDKFIYTTEVDP